jgi:hypothetical protein
VLDTAHDPEQLQAAIRELLRRKRCQESLHSYALNIDIPTVPFEAPQPDEDLTGPAALLMAGHHAKILEVLQRTMTRFMGRCMIFAPPGSAKSLYTSVLAPTWYMGKFPGSRIILTSYAAELAERQARRAIQIAESEKYRCIWKEQPIVTKDAAKEWVLSNKSEMLSMGILGGLTGNRANGAIVDDPVSGREDADSEAMRKKTLDAYQDDLMTRLLPGAWLAFIMTRWHEMDLAGSILPDDYKGESGMIVCKDGLVWEILNIEAKCERADDPLGRQIGEYIWPEFYPPQHWHQFENKKGADAQRTWSSLYQQRPAPHGSGRFHESMFDFYQPGTQPTALAYVGAGDYAVTAGGNDFTELAVFGVDCNGDLWEVDWWSEQSDTGTSSDATIDMMIRWKTPMWFNEGGVIDKSMGPLLNLKMREYKDKKGKKRPVYCDRRTITSMQDKVAKCGAFQGRAAAGGEIGSTGRWNTGRVHFRDNANSRRVIGQLIALPAGRYDDAADVCGLIGRAMDQFPVARPIEEKKRVEIRPFTAAWFEWNERQPKPNLRYR